MKNTGHYAHDEFYDNIYAAPISNYRKEKLIVTQRLDELVLETTYNNDNKINTVFYNTIGFVDFDNVTL